MKDNNVLLMRGLKKEMNHGEVHDDSIKAEEKKKIRGKTKQVWLLLHRGVRGGVIVFAINHTVHRGAISSKTTHNGGELQVTMA